MRHAATAATANAKVNPAKPRSVPGRRSRTHTEKKSNVPIKKEMPCSGEKKREAKIPREASPKVMSIEDPRR
jgi:hypothetical protein